MVKPARRRELACRAKVEYDVSIRVACDVLSISTTCYFYKPTLVNENAEIEDWLKRLTTTHKRWGFGLCFDFLRNTKGFKWNHKRVYRIYRELELNLRISLGLVSNVTNPMLWLCLQRLIKFGRWIL